MAKRSPTQKPVRKALKRLRPESRFFVIHRGEVVFQSAKLLDSIQRSIALRGSIAAGRMCSNTGSEPDTERDPRNPVGETLERLTYTVEESIMGAIDSRLGDRATLTDGAISRGIVYENGSRRVATNEEAANWSFDLSLSGSIDRRKPMPIQFAKWLRKQAAQLAKIADSVEEIQDGSNRKILRQVVNDPEYLPGILAQGMEIDRSGDLVTKGGAV